MLDNTVDVLPVRSGNSARSVLADRSDAAGPRAFQAWPITLECRIGLVGTLPVTKLEPLAAHREIRCIGTGRVLP